MSRKNTSSHAKPRYEWIDQMKRHWAFVTIVSVALLVIGWFFGVQPILQKRDFQHIEQDMSAAQQALKSDTYAFTLTKYCGRDQEKWAKGALSCSISMDIAIAAKDNGDFLGRSRVVKSTLLSSGFSEVAHSKSDGQGVSESVFTPLVNTATGYSCLLSNNTDSSRFGLRLDCSHQVRWSYF